MGLKLSRRELGLAALAGTMLAQAQEGPVEEPLEDQALDPVYWTRMRHDSAPLRMTFRAGNKKQAEAWQKIAGRESESETPARSDRPSRRHRRGTRALRCRPKPCPRK